MSPKNTRKRSKIILFNEYDGSFLWSLITNHDNFELNINTIFPYTFSFDPVSSPSMYLLKIKIFTPFFISDSTVLRKMDHFDISFVIWKLSKSWELTKPTLLDPDYFPGSQQRPLICSEINNHHGAALPPSNATRGAARFRWWGARLTPGRHMALVVESLPPSAADESLLKVAVAR